MQWTIVITLQEIKLHLGSVHVTVQIHNESLNTAQTGCHTPLENANRLWAHIIPPPHYQSMNTVVVSDLHSRIVHCADWRSRCHTKTNLQAVD